MSILVKSILVGTAALIAAVSMILIVVPLFGDKFQASMFVNAVIGCYQPPPAQQRQIHNQKQRPWGTSPLRSIRISFRGSGSREGV